MCRALHTLLTGQINSKPQAAAWVIANYPDWQPIIEQALIWRSQHEIDDLTATMSFMRATLAKALDICDKRGLCQA
jgi:hypothetical protein